MAGFSGALDRFTNQVAILETSIGRAFDNDGNGGFLTGATLAATKFVQVLGEANPRLLRAGSEAVLLAGGFAALKSVDFFRNGFGLKTAASALDRSAIMLDEAAVKLGASKGTLPGGVVPPGGAPVAEAPSKSFFGKGGFKGGMKGAMLGGPAAIAEALAYQAGTGLIDTGIKALPFAQNSDATQQYLENRGSIDIVRDLWGNMTGSAKLAGHRAAGGPVGLGRSYLVGEHGPEIFTPGATGQITSNTKMLAALARSDRDSATAGEVRYMGRELVTAVDGVARAVASLKDTSASWNGLHGEEGGESFGGEGGGGGGGAARGAAGGGRRGFMSGGSVPNLGGTGKASSGRKVTNGATLMDAAENQLIAEGVPKEHARAAAAALVGNVVQESGGDPNKLHDKNPKTGQYTGYGLYGARLERRDRMLTWLAQNGYAKNDAAGQMRYMAHEAMTSKEYGRTANALRSATQGNVGAVTDTVAENFERPNRRSANFAGRRNNAATAFGSDVGGGVSPGEISGSGAQSVIGRASSLLGASASQAAHALGAKMTPGLWCADFVNGVLKAQGIQGTGSSAASSFRNYGAAVGRASAVHKGDVLVEGHHVGIATGEIDSRGRLGMVSGNYSHKVSKSWEDPSKIISARRVPGIDNEAPGLRPQDDPLGLRRQRAGGGLNDHPATQPGRKITPAVDNSHLERTAALLDHIHGRMHGINVASARHKVVGGGAHVAGLGSRTRGSFTASGLTIG